ncbi:O-antigen polysaccharide polymerase Wzy [Enterococcus dongliensis]|uniref:O-antigen polysaccharide polymerase Wzy n=1 Tax=Enterococcus dongliensis TaxID=2559925 RepID=UPI002890BA82|nr:O-antigen polysaccharide polymerase Wzy [Enterococcus dongliensis]MDT2712391.1 O-antigen polysaccharide polymerase Wzy [Enterococcus dongliensis]
MTVNRRVFNKILIQIFFLMIIIGVYQFSNHYTDTVLFRILAAFSLTSFILFVILNASGVMTAQWFTVLFLYLYNCGQVWLHLFGVPFSKSSFLITQYSYSEIHRSIFFFLVAINIFQIFINFFYKDDLYGELQWRNTIEDCSELKSTLVVFSVFAFVLVTYNDVISIISARTLGYVASYTMGRDNPIIYMMIYLYPLLTVLWQMIGTPTQKKVIMIYSVLRCLTMMLLVGNRGQYIALLILLFLLQHKEREGHERRSFKQLLAIIILGVILLVIAGYVSNTRNIISGQMSVKEYLLKGNIFFSMLQELGSTFINTILVVNLCPDSLHFAFGKSYIAGLVQLIPKASSVFSSIGRYGNLGSVLNGFFSKGSGLGGSYIAELYYNFSWFSVLVIPFFSWILVKLDGFTNNTEISILKKAIAYYYIYATFMFVRGEFSDFAVYTRYLFYFLVVYWVLRSFRRRNS